MSVDAFLLRRIIRKAHAPDEERIKLDVNCLSPRARPELLTVGGFPFATVAPP
jgi:hypothetical protein